MKTGCKHFCGICVLSHYMMLYYYQLELWKFLLSALWNPGQQAHLMHSFDSANFVIIYVWVFLKQNVWIRFTDTGTMV